MLYCDLAPIPVSGRRQGLPGQALSRIVREAVTVKILGRKNRACSGDADRAEPSKAKRARLIFSLSPRCLLIYLLLSVGCNAGDPGQRDWRLYAERDNGGAMDGSDYKADVRDAGGNTADKAEVGQPVDDANAPDADQDGCRARPEVCDGEDNDCDGETDEPGASQNCKLTNANALCEAGRCVIASCYENYDDCDRDDANGCETRLTANDNCGACKVVCEVENATATCSSRSCEIESCDDGYADCNDDPGDGCETSLDSPMHCGSCDHACPTSEVGSGSSYACVQGECELIGCEVGWGDCDNDPENGCETDLFNSFNNCGSCRRRCWSINADRCVEGFCSCGERGSSCRWPNICCDDGSCRLACI